jgi:hypothetical protein
VPSTSPTSAPSPSSTVVPAGFKALSVTFASPTEGWVLGVEDCGTATCGTIAHTLDAGRTWSTIPAPATSVNPSGGTNAPSGVSTLRFADPTDGWAFGPELWVTHGGGQTWNRLSVSGLSGDPVVALEAAHGIVYAVFLDGAHDRFRIASTPVGSDIWTLSPLSLPIGAGPIPAIQLVLSGAAGWIIQNDRTVVNGARLVNGVWRSWQPVCSGVVGPAYLAASSSTDLVATCDIGAFSSPQGVHLYVSSDGGMTFGESATAVPAQQGYVIASPDPSKIVIGATPVNGANTSVLLGSFNGGASWMVVAKPSDVSFTDLGFTTTTQGVVITSAGQLLMTRDAGDSWAAASF